MKSEIRIVKLERETLVENGSLEKNGPDERMQSYFATDYFDSLTITKKSLNTPLADIMNMNNKKKDKEKENGRKTSVQSYTMYFSQKMWQRYEKDCQGNDRKEADTVRTHRGDPFGEKNKRLPYVSIIQVHLTPEILRWTTYGESELWDENSIILEPFLDDLYDVVGKTQLEDDFIYRVYQVLSAGDLAVVIKSGRPETSYKISSRIRQRAVKEKKNPSKRWALYKTYTVLAIEYQANLKEAQNNVSGKFVVRGCYSCKYWGERGAALKTGVEKESDLMFGLNGRYDFSMSLSIEEFAELYPIIQRYKGIDAGNFVKAEKEPDLSGKKLKEMPPKVEYLMHLLENHYLSYINERYLPEKQELDKNNDDAENIQLRNDVKGELSGYNESYASELLDKFKKVKDETIRLRDAHKNLEQYFNLMERQILSCYTINQVSDTRVYVPRIEKQLEIALDAISIYREIIEQEKNVTRINLLVDNIKEVVHMLDSYTAYIRNNNLQSLQTPNYNIESSMGMEKILIGYNEYLGRLITTYQRVFEKEQGKTQESHEKKYFPIVIPDLHYMDISVRGLFLEGIGFDWTKEQKIRKDKGSNGRLIIVESPTLAELGDIPVFMALLFHEVAHQFRYEDRKVRNKTLLNLLVDKYVSGIAFNIAEKVCWDICASEVRTTLQRKLVSGLKMEVLTKIEAYFNQEENKERWDAPLMYFKEEALGLLNDFSQSWSRQMDMEGHTKYFIKSLQKRENLCSEYQFKYIEKMKHFLDNAVPNKIIQTNKEWKEIRTKLVRYAFTIAGIAACGTLKTDDVKGFEWMWEENGVENWLRKPEDEVQYEDLWDGLRAALKVFDGDDDRSDKVEWAKKAFDNICRYYQPPADDAMHKSYFIGIDKMLEEVHKELCRAWKDMEEKCALIVSGEEAESIDMTAEIYRSWSLVGRYLGIDYDMKDNGEKFSKLLRNNNFTTVDKRDLEQRVAVYREVTADMFMYTMMKMTPFAYLNLMASIIPTINLEGINLERIVTVLYIMTGKDDGVSNKLIDIYYAEMDAMWTELINYCASVLYNGNFDADFVKLLLILRVNGKNEYKKKRTNADFSQMIANVGEAAKKKSEKKDVLIHIKKICDLLQAITEQERNYIFFLEKNKAVKDDYINGKKTWKKLRNNMAAGLEPQNKLIKDLLELSEKSKMYLKDKHYKVGEVKDEKLNEEGIKFLLRSYYSQKIKDSRMEREE